MSYAGPQALKDMFGGGHYGTVRAHCDRWQAFREVVPLRTGVWCGPTFRQVCDAIDMGSYTAKSRSLGS